MTRTFTLIGALTGAALVLALPAWSQAQPDAFERAAAAQARGTIGVQSDAVERAVAAREHTLSPAMDAHARTGTTARPTASISSGFPVDAFQRALLNTAASTGLPRDSHDRVIRDVAPAVSVATSGREIEWPQIAIGFALGVLLVAGLALGLRASRMRPLAH